MSGTPRKLNQQQQQQYASIAASPQHRSIIAMSAGPGRGTPQRFTRHPEVENAAVQELGLRPEQVHERSIRELTSMVNAHRQRNHEQQQQAHAKSLPVPTPQQQQQVYKTSTSSTPMFNKPIVEAPSSSVFRQHHQQQQQQQVYTTRPDGKRSHTATAPAGRGHTPLSTLDREFESSEDEGPSQDDELYDAGADDNDNDNDSGEAAGSDHLLKRIIQMFGLLNDDIVQQCKDLGRTEKASGLSGSEFLFTVSEQNIIKNARQKKLAGMRAALYENMERLYQQRAHQIKKLSEEGAIDSFDEQTMQVKQTEMHSLLRELHAKASSLPSSPAPAASAGAGAGTSNARSAAAPSTTSSSVSRPGPGPAQPQPQPQAQTQVQQRPAVEVKKVPQSTTAPARPATATASATAAASKPTQRPPSAAAARAPAAFRASAPLAAVKPETAIGAIGAVATPSATPRFSFDD